MNELVDWLRGVLDEEEQWAREASRGWDGQIVAGGLRWRWECGECDHEIVPDPMVDPELTCPNPSCGGSRRFLRSVEEFPSSVGPLNTVAIGYAVEVPAAAAGLILRHDPARVLAQVHADRTILDLWQDPAEVAHLPDGVHDGRDQDEVDAQIAAAQAVDLVVRLRALAYAAWPGYREEWRP